MFVAHLGHCERLESRALEFVHQNAFERSFCWCVLGLEASRADEVYGFLKAQLSALTRCPNSALAYQTAPRQSHDEVDAPRAPLGVPVWKPFLNLRGTSFNDRIRPVPVVFLLLAFSDQLSASSLATVVPTSSQLCIAALQMTSDIDK